MEVTALCGYKHAPKEANETKKADTEHLNEETVILPSVLFQRIVISMLAS